MAMAIVYRPRLGVVISLPCGGDSADYDIKKAREALQKAGSFKVVELYSAGAVTKLPYPGIGVPPSRPGGDIDFVGRQDLQKLDKAVTATIRAGPHKRLYVLGPRGVGKSCLLRALAWILLKTAPPEYKLVCIWDLRDGHLVKIFKQALCFTYCQDEVVLAEIEVLLTVEEIEAFMEAKRQSGQKFLFIVDGIEVLDPRDSTGVARDNSEEKIKLKQDFEKLTTGARCCVFGLSPLAEMVRIPTVDDNTGFAIVNDTLDGDELHTYINKVTVFSELVNLVPDRVKDINYYAADHLLSLAVLDGCCKMYVQEKLNRYSEDPEAVRPFDAPEKTMNLHEVALHLQDGEDWDEVITRFLSSPEIWRVRAGAKKHFEKPNFQLPANCYQIEDMARLDMRYVYQTPTSYDYVTPFIKRIYIEELRAVEQRTRFKVGAWAPYCRYLIDNDVQINWAEMGWILEEVVGDVLSYKGLVLNGMVITRVATRKFFRIPDYRLWKRELTGRGGIFFVPAASNYPLIDGVIAWRDSSGCLHFYALQITVNEEGHQDSTCFMDKEIIKDWIPEEELKDWILHFAFICLKDKEVVVVPQNLKTLKSGIQYGNVEYQLHTVSFLKAMEGYVEKGLIDMVAAVANCREDAGWKGRGMNSASTSEANKLVTVPVTMTNKPRRVAAILKVLSRASFKRSRLGKLAGEFGINVKDTDLKEEVSWAIAERISSMDDGDDDEVDVE